MTTQQNIGLKGINSKRFPTSFQKICIQHCILIGKALAGWGSLAMKDLTLGVSKEQGNQKEKRGHVRQTHHSVQPLHNSINSVHNPVGGEACPPFEGQRPSHHASRAMEDGAQPRSRLNIMPFRSNHYNHHNIAHSRNPKRIWWKILRLRLLQGRRGPELQLMVNGRAGAMP